MKILFILLIVAVSLSIPALWGYGIVISFYAHPITGLLAVIAEPAPFVIGVADLFWDYNIAEVFTDKFIR